MPPVRILRALGIITSNVTEISLLHFSLTTVERSWEKRHKIWTFELTRGTNQTSIHSTPSAKSESGSTTFTASSSEHLCVQKLKLDAFLTQQVQSSLNRKLLTLLAEGSGRGEGKKGVFLTRVNVLSQYPELRVVLKSHQTTLLHSIYLRRR